MGSQGEFQGHQNNFQGSHSGFQEQQQPQSQQGGKPRYLYRLRENRQSFNKIEGGQNNVETY